MLAKLVGWRGMFVVAAALMLALAVVLRFALPPRHPAQKLSYAAVMRSLIDVFRRVPELRRRMLVGAFGFASFSVFWSMLSFQLSTLGYGSATAGLFGVIGIVGVLVAPWAGRRSMGKNALWLNIAGLSIEALSFVVFWLGRRSLPGLGAGVVMLDAGVQMSHLTNQTVIFGMHPELRSRINALYMVGYFAGGGLGTAAASVAWGRAGWAGVCAVGAAFALMAMLPLRGSAAAQG